VWPSGSCSVCSSLALDPVLALVFTRDAAVRHELRPVLLAVALMQPLGGAVFVLDGILIGAGDVRYLALAMAGATLCFIPCAVLVLSTGAGTDVDAEIDPTSTRGAAASTSAS
jgi:Na+-driven multidrug efflux pump